jgi:hypothetical protein
VKMIWHYDEFVEQVSISVSIVEYGCDQNLGYLWDLENVTALGAPCGDEIGRAGSCAVV